MNIRHTELSPDRQYEFAGTRDLQNSEALSTSACWVTSMNCDKNRAGPRNLLWKKKKMRSWLKKTVCWPQSLETKFHADQIHFVRNLTNASPYTFESFDPSMTLGGLNSNHCSGRRGFFKLTATLNVFTNVRCTDAGNVCGKLKVRTLYRGRYWGVNLKIISDCSPSM